MPRLTSEPVLAHARTGRLLKVLCPSVSSLSPHARLFCATSHTVYSACSSAVGPSALMQLSHIGTTDNCAARMYISVRTALLEPFAPILPPSGLHADSNNAPSILSWPLVQIHITLFGILGYFNLTQVLTHVVIYRQWAGLCTHFHREANSLLHLFLFSLQKTLWTGPKSHRSVGGICVSIYNHSIACTISRIAKQKILRFLPFSLAAYLDSLCRSMDYRSLVRIRSGLQ